MTAGMAEAAAMAAEGEMAVTEAVMAAVTAVDGSTSQYPTVTEPRPRGSRTTLDHLNISNRLESMRRGMLSVAIGLSFTTGCPSRPWVKMRRELRPCLLTRWNW